MMKSEGHWNHEKSENKQETIEQFFKSFLKTESPPAASYRLFMERH